MSIEYQNEPTGTHLDFDVSIGFGAAGMYADTFSLARTGPMSCGSP